jgi:hypothetical protein
MTLQHFLHFAVAVLILALLLKLVALAAKRWYWR